MERNRRDRTPAGDPDARPASRSPRPTDAGPRMTLTGRLIVIGATVVAMGGAMMVADSIRDGRDAPGAERTLGPLLSDEAIAAEALVFRTRPGDLATGTSAEKRVTAHPRTLEMYRGLRAYPGAPPRVPHGLTADEFRGTLCSSCHERGGFSARFGAYVPITPHPELTDCLQCHAVSDALVGLDLPRQEPDAHCRQCHSPTASVPRFAALDWRPLTWPQLAPPSPTGAPPAIPHDLQLRGDCLACHAGPAAVEEIRTTHPERSNCRQCHLQVVTDAGGFVRPGRGD
jgi:nitrate reductase (cytochrome), electron transfer subunit